MSLKMIAIPLLVLSIAIFSTWFVYPAYQEMKAVSQSVGQEKAKNEKIEKQKENMEKLADALETRKKNTDAVNEYIPADKKEEDIINDLNDIAFTNGLTVMEISFNKENSTTAYSQLVPFTVDPTTGEPAVIDPATGQTIIMPAPKEKFVEINLVALGEYDQVKALLRKLSAIKRYSEIKSVKISKNMSTASSGSENEAEAKILKLEAMISFNYLKGVKEIDSLDNALLVADKFDFSVAEQIVKEKNTAVPPINITANGRENPFVLP